jgi:hypothetical protein
MTTKPKADWDFEIPEGDLAFTVEAENDVLVVEPYVIEVPPEDDVIVVE